MSEEDNYNCPCCKQSKTVRHTGVENWESSWEEQEDLKPIRIQWYQCSECLLVFKTPRPSEEDCRRYYESMSAWKDYTAPRRYEMAKQFIVSTMLTLWRRSLWSDLPKKPLGLDVGSKDGAFLGVLGIPGDAIDAAPQGPGDPSWVPADGIAAGKVEEQRDIVVASHVLEHVLNPVFFLAWLQTQLKPSGVIYVEVPSLHGRCSQLMQKSHLQCFSIASLLKCAADAGLACLNVTTEEAEHCWKSGSSVIRALFAPTDAVIDMQGNPGRLLEEARTVSGEDISQARAILIGQKRADTVLYGASEGLLLAASEATGALDDYAAIADRSKHGKTIYGRPIVSPEVLIREDISRVIITSRSPAVASDIEGWLNQHYPGKKLGRLYSGH